MGMLYIVWFQIITQILQPDPEPGILFAYCVETNAVSGVSRPSLSKFGGRMTTNPLKSTKKPKPTGKPPAAPPVRPPYQEPTKR